MKRFPAIRLPFVAAAMLMGAAQTARAADDFNTAKAMMATWVANGSAAGLEGVMYDNRDGGHSLLKLSHFPGLQKVPYAKEEVRSRGWGLQPRVLPQVTFGNSSTAGPVHQYGSHIRGTYSNAHMVSILYQQYIKNNLYIYPEHRDHDPGPGKGGYGDLMPLNTPYLIGTQGSSGSDQPVLLAVGLALGCLQPETKKVLVEKGLLMPTIQMLYRTCQSNVVSKEDYLSGKAHPSVFVGKRIQYGRLANKAHDLMARDIPAMVQLKVLEEEAPRPEIDYFESGGRTEKLCDTPAAIGRIFRGRQYQRKLVVSAEDSFDINGRLRTFHWVVLRGDPARIKITPRNPRQSEVEIIVSYQPRQPIPDSPTIESNRVDIGVFIDNGRQWSAPGFICFYSLDNEKRTYDDHGRIQEMDYTAGRFVDKRLTTPKPWRDVYRYANGVCQGWTRHYTDGREEQYTDDGRLERPTGKDGTAESVPVRYQIVAGAKPGTQKLQAVPQS